eukprot:TRINITY_DN19250_c0_g2_i1.p1 TRINITY_DN19250_c0_g2~~TRINITY_DN19250_c0_g2_i1.p1  ORF type:complete len:334 (-),score=24.23 TRINITY_DN19250_c0_g2_i1:313-1314(-)
MAYSFSKSPQSNVDTFASLLDNDIDNIPANLTCPLTHELFRDPVILISTGQTYERSEIQTWFKINHTDPLSGVEIKDTTLVPNLAIKGLCDEYLQRQNKRQEYSKLEYSKQEHSQQEYSQQYQTHQAYDSLSMEIMELYYQLSLKTKSYKQQVERVGQAQKAMLQVKEVSLQVLKENKACLEGVLQAFSQMEFELELCLEGKAIVSAKQVLENEENFEKQFVAVSEILTNLVEKEVSFDAEFKKQLSIQKEVRDLQSVLVQKHREHGTPVSFTDDVCMATCLSGDWNPQLHNVQKFGQQSQSINLNPDKECFSMAQSQHYYYKYDDFANTYDM